VLVELREHLRVIPDDAARVGERALQLVLELDPLRLVRQLAQLRVDVGLARPADRLAAEASDRAVRLALDRQQRMEQDELPAIHPAQRQAHGVDDERLVRDQDLDGRAPRAMTARVADAHANLSGQALGGEGGRVDRELVQRVGTAAAQLGGIERRLELGAHERVERVLLRFHRRALIGVTGLTSGE
jgi:hypothetical protein